MGIWRNFKGTRHLKFRGYLKLISKSKVFIIKTDVFDDFSMAGMRFFSRKCLKIKPRMVKIKIAF